MSGSNLAPHPGATSRGDRCADHRLVPSRKRACDALRGANLGVCPTARECLLRRLGCSMPVRGHNPHNTEFVDLATPWSQGALHHTSERSEQHIRRVWLIFGKQQVHHMVGASFLARLARGASSDSASSSSITMQLLLVCPGCACATDLAVTSAAPGVLSAREAWMAA